MGDMVLMGVMKWWGLYMFMSGVLLCIIAEWGSEKAKGLACGFAVLTSSFSIYLTLTANEASLKQFAHGKEIPSDQMKAIYGNIGFCAFNAILALLGCVKASSAEARENRDNKQ